MKNFVYLLFIILCPHFVLAKDECKCEASFADLVDPLLPAVVNITVSKYQANSGIKKGQAFPPGSPFEEFNQFFERFGMIPPIPEDYGSNGASKKLVPFSTGSGFIIDKSGYIVTNHHVIKDADKISVKLHNDKQYNAKVIGSDSRTDVALLKIKTHINLPYVTFGDSTKVRVGDIIVAIGNPFGLGGTVTTGIVSARSRDIPGASSLVDNFIQTDAAINKGNSGGPMFNQEGKVIGINTAIYSPSGGNVGIGFAVPSSTAKIVIDQLKSSGRVTRAWLGVTIQSTSDIAEGLGIKDNKGALVVNVEKGSPADRYGISVGDIILGFNQQEITNVRKFSRMVAEAKIGKVVKIDLMSKGKKKSVYLKLSELDNKQFDAKISGKKTINNSQSKRVQGISVIDLSTEIRSKYRIDNNVSKGVFVTKVKESSEAYRRGVKPGDILVAVNQKQIDSVANFTKLITELKKRKKQSVMLWINRKGVNIFLQLPIK